MPYIPVRFLSPEQLDARRATDRDRRWRKRGTPSLKDPTKPLASSTLRTRAYRARQKELRQARTMSGLSPKPSRIGALLQSLSADERAEILAQLAPVPCDQIVPAHHVPQDINPLELSPQWRRLQRLSKAVLSGHPTTQTPDFLLALTALEASVFLPDSHAAPEPIMPEVLVFD